VTQYVLYIPGPFPLRAQGLKRRLPCVRPPDSTKKWAFSRLARRDCPLIAVVGAELYFAQVPQ